MKIKILLPFLIVAIAGCTSNVRHLNMLDDSVAYYDYKAKECDVLETTANIAHNYAHAEMHKAKAEYYREKVHQFQDSIFNSLK